jgi:hypothetical protein
MVGVLTHPGVSVVMPVRDAEPYICASIDSILGQTYADLELIVVDDLSRDSSAEIVRGYEQRDARVSAISLRTHLGHAGAVNAGLAAATGEVVALQDADDVAAPSRLARQLACLRANPRTCLVGSDARITDAGGRVVSGTRFPTTPVAVRWRLLFANAAINLMWRRKEIGRSVGGYDTAVRYAADYDFVARVASCHDVRNVPETLLDYRRHPAAMGRRKREAEAHFAESISRRELRRLDGDLSHDSAVRLRLLSTGAGSKVRSSDLPMAMVELSSLHSRFCERWQRSSWTSSDVRQVEAMLRDAESAAFVCAAKHSAALAWRCLAMAITADVQNGVRLPVAVIERLAERFARILAVAQQ